MAQYSDVPSLPTDPWQVAPRMRHYFLNYLCIMLETSFFEFLQRHGFQDMDRIWYGVEYVSEEDGRKTLKFAEWSTPGRMEVSDWATFFRRNQDILPVDKLAVDPLEHGLFYTLPYVYSVRNAAIHRDDVSYAHLKRVMRLVGMLGDHAGAEQIRKVFQVAASTHSTLNTGKEAIVRAAFMRVAFPNDISLWTKHDLLYGIQLTLETCCFRYAKRADFAWLQDSEFFFEEQVELQKYQEHWAPKYNDWTQARQDEFPDPDGTLLGKALWKARELRNHATHRPPLRDDDQVVEHVHNAMQLAIILGDRAAAIKIEIIAEQFLTGSPKIEVLERLRSNYLKHVPAPLNLQREARRRIAISFVLELAGLNDKPVMTDVEGASKQFATLRVSSEDTNDNQRRESVASSSSEQSDISTGTTESQPDNDLFSNITTPDLVKPSPYPLTWSPSMHEVLKGAIWENSPSPEIEWIEDC